MKTNRKATTNYIPAQGKPASFIRFMQENPGKAADLFHALTLVVNEIDNGTLTPTSQNAANAATIARDIWAGICEPDLQERSAA